MTTNLKPKRIGYHVFNYTDNIYASTEPIPTKMEAKEFIQRFRNRYNRQGYYRNNRWEQIKPKDIDLEIIPANFSPYSGKTY